MDGLPCAPFLHVNRPLGVTSRYFGRDITLLTVVRVKIEGKLPCQKQRDLDARRKRVGGV